MSDRYILGPDGEPVRCPDLLEWCRWYESADQRVACDEAAGVRVSTVFLGLDHGLARRLCANVPAPPILWETMVFGGEHNGRVERYSSRADALAGHRELCREVGVPTRE
jgi:hypothetical protein